MKIPVYPYDLGDTSKYDDAPDEMIQGWIEEALQKLIENPSSHAEYHLSGNTMVAVVRNTEYDDTSLHQYRVFVSKNFRSALVHEDKEGWHIVKY